MTLPDWLECSHLKLVAGEVPGLAFRGLRDVSDAETISRISHLSWKADGIEWLLSPGDIASGLLCVSGQERGADVLFAEVDGTPIAYSHISWDPANADQGYYRQAVHVLPEWRGRGIMKAMFHSNEDRLKAISLSHGSSEKRGVQVWAVDAPNEWKELVESVGYVPSWHLLEMVHKDLGSVKDPPVPLGLDFGPAQPEDYPRVWSLCRECFSNDMWSTTGRWAETEYREWHESERFTPELWKIARMGSDVVGLVENYVSDEECRALGRKVAHSNMVCVREDWRRKGVATYLLASSLKLLRDMGVGEVTLDTEVENVSRAMRVYEGVGFVVRRSYTFYRKPV